MAVTGRGARDAAVPGSRARGRARTVSRLILCVSIIVSRRAGNRVFIAMAAVVVVVLHWRRLLLLLLRRRLLVVDRNWSRRGWRRRGRVRWRVVVLVARMLVLGGMGMVVVVASWRIDRRNRWGRVVVSRLRWRRIGVVPRGWVTRINSVWVWRWRGRYGIVRRQERVVHAARCRKCRC